MVLWGGPAGCTVLLRDWKSLLSLDTAVAVNGTQLRTMVCVIIEPSLFA